MRRQIDTGGRDLGETRTTYQLFVDGEARPSDSGETFSTSNPATGEVLAAVARATAADVDHAVASAREAFQGSDWGGLDPAKRGRLLHRVAAAIRGHAEELARLESLDNGKTLKEAAGDVAYVARTWEYYAGLADKIEGKTIPVPGLRFDYTRVEPVGVTAHIVPWNYPLVLGSRGLAPALAAGNTAVVKPSSWAPLTNLRLAEVAHEAGLPAGVWNVVPGSGSEAGEALARHEDVDLLTLTGSVETGKAVMQAAAEHITPVILELGGKCPNIVFGDADLSRALRGVLRGILTNAGQMCWAGSRLLVEETVQADFLRDLKAKAEAWVVGPGTAEGSQMGPLISEEQVERVLGYVDTGQEEGATLLTGGSRLEDGALAKGHFVGPTIFRDVTPEMTLAQEEIFGPVLSVLPFADPEEAVAVANQSVFGLCAGIWTKDLGLAHRTAAAIDAGVVSINEYPITFPQTPFGGFKESGIGQEQGLDAVYQYCRVKTVNVNLL